MEYFKQTKNKEQWFLGFVLLLALIIFLFTIQNYGAGYDEPYLYDYADGNLLAYSKVAVNQPYQNIFSFADLRYYGPAFLILGGQIKNLILLVLPLWDRYDAWHLINFSAFLFSAWMLFMLCQRLVSKRAALFAALLYLTQPLLWGHGIMNPKDSPFMIFFITSLAVGVKMVEKMAGDRLPEKAGVMPKAAKGSRLGWGRRAKYFSAIGLVLFAITAADRIFQNFLSLPAITAFIQSARLAPPGTFLNTIFLKFAAQSDQISDLSYIEKAMTLINTAEFAILVLVCLIVFMIMLRKADGKVRWTLLAGFVLGVTISIRILGPAAAGLVILYMLVKKIRRPLRYISIYLGMGLLTAFILWPYIWSDTLNRLVESVQVMANFPWPGVVLFEGVFSRPKDLPWYYLIKLLAIQFTLPLVILAIGGIGLAVYRAARRSPGWAEVLIPLVWFLTPVLAEIALNLSLYNNFRQFLFITPALFMLAALAFDWLAQRIRMKALVVALSVVLLLPGMIAQVWLYPMQYIYYNGLVGWTGQVYGQYETDYWGTGLCQTAQYVNKNAPAGASIAIHDVIMENLFRHCSRYNNFTIYLGNADQIYEPIEYAVVSERFINAKNYFLDMPIIKTIGLENVPFYVVRKAVK